MLEELATDEEYYVRLHVAANPNTPPKALEKLANDITNISYEPADTTAKLKFKASRERLTRAELLGVNEIKPTAPQPVFILRPPPTGGIGKPPPSGFGVP